MLKCHVRIEFFNMGEEFYSAQKSFSNILIICQIPAGSSAMRRATVKEELHSPAGTSTQALKERNYLWEFSNPGWGPFGRKTAYGNLAVYMSAFQLQEYRVGKVFTLKSAWVNYRRDWKFSETCIETLIKGSNQPDMTQFRNRTRLVGGLKKKKKVKIAETDPDQTWDRDIPRGTANKEFHPVLLWKA